MNRLAWGRAGHGGSGAAAVVMALLACVGSLTQFSGCKPGLPELMPLAAPEMGNHEPSVRAAVDKAIHAVQALQGRPGAGADAATLAAAYGELAMTCHAHDLVGCADSAYGNAALLAPRDLRWPYLRGHLHQDTARLDEALRHFEAALAADGQDAPTLFSLAEARLKAGDNDRAEALFKRLLERPDGRVPALWGLGRVAMARSQPREAVGHFEEALRLQPGAGLVRAPLAVAYHALGDEAAAARVKAGGPSTGVEPAPPDPHVNALGDHVASSRALLRRSQRLAQATQHAAALAVLRRAEAANAADPEIHAHLGVVLANLGRGGEAEAALRRSLALDARSAGAQFTLAAVLDRQGRDADAIDAYRAALAIEPTHPQAQLYLADALMRSGQAAAAAEGYRKLVERAPNSRLRMSLALALLRRGDEAAARAELERAIASDPHHAGLSNGLARMLATAASRRLRDGPRALRLAQGLLERAPNVEVGQTVAMALAASGDFTRAVVMQESAIAALGPSAQVAQQRFLAANLAAFKKGMPARSAWMLEDPIFQPRAPAVARATATPS